MTFFTFSWGKNYIAIRALLRKLGHDLQTPPPVREQTTALGIANSPPFLCYSGKVVIGQLVEQLEAGCRNFIYLSSFGPEACRCGGTGAFLEELSRNRYPDIHACRLGGSTFRESLEVMQCAFPGTTVRQHTNAFRCYFVKLAIIHHIEQTGMKSRALGSDPARIERAEQTMYERIDRMQWTPALLMAAMLYPLRMALLGKKRHKPLLRIGITGGEHILSELDAVTARIRKLALQGILLDWRSSFYHINRFADATSVTGTECRAYYERQSSQYLTPGTGGTETITAARALEFAREGYDGILHIYAFGCLPQISVLPALRKIASDYGIPFMSLCIGDRFDLQTLETRLDAFIDILAYRHTEEFRP
jgi:hypothetical protein